KLLRYQRPNCGYYRRDGGEYGRQFTRALAHFISSFKGEEHRAVGSEEEGGNRSGKQRIRVKQIKKARYNLFISVNSNAAHNISKCHAPQNCGHPRTERDAPISA